ncbi:YnbE family lipoprotein [Paraglaciecola sp. 2405UD69-4]|uniref:YnbE family lipoprotein n=1 Tax=Paraglaciecola sp. 2405UD69-4 TaxID=3391836 RepID=UPI0039C9425A
MRIPILVLTVLGITACTHKVQVETKEPITININVKIDHEIRVKVDKELDDVFNEDSSLF